MFKGGNGKVEGPTNSPDQLNRIVEGTRIKGEVNTESNFRLDGILVGSLITSGKLVIGVSGKVEGEISCNNADIEGEILGNIKVQGLLTLKSTAKITGNIKAGKIAVENGAEFNGDCAIGNTSATKNHATNLINEVKEQEKTKAELASK